MCEALEVGYEMCKDLYQSGVMDEETMRKVELLYFSDQRELTPEDIRRIRTKNDVSQSVFAAILGTEKILIEHWEQGITKPNEMAKRLLDLIDRKGIAVLV
ncbi:MAG: transcriptional regulator [Deltaproteobacteria bacterium]|nr:MAG: transcriptional regulator [Deltaproteobacteria bacterium]